MTYRTHDPIADADRYFSALDAERDRYERSVRSRMLGDVTVTLGDGEEVELHDVVQATAHTWNHPGEPWEWSNELPAGVDEQDVVDALEDQHGRA